MSTATTPPETSRTRRGIASRTRREFLKTIGAGAALLLGGAATAGSAAARRDAEASAGPDGAQVRTGRLQRQLADLRQRTGDPRRRFADLQRGPGGLQQQLIGTLTAGQGLWYQPDYQEPIQYVSWIPPTRTHAFFKFGLGNVAQPWHGLGHRETIIEQPNGFTFSPDSGLVVNHLWNLSPVHDERGQTRWVLFLALNVDRVGTQFRQEIIEILRYDGPSDSFAVYNHTLGREGRWQRYA